MNARTMIWIAVGLVPAACDPDDDAELYEETEGEDTEDDDTEDDDTEGDAEFRALTWVTTSASVGPKAWYNKTFTKYANTRYTVCITPTSGDPNLYGDYDEAFSGTPKTSNVGFAQYWSENGNLTPDCIWFDTAQTGTYYLGVYGYPSTQSSAFSMWRVDSPIAKVPTGFAKALSWPLPNSCNSLVNRFSGFNSPWGNPESVNNPFFSGHKDKIHSGVDIACTPGSIVRSACTGSVVRRGNLDTKWGQYVVVQCDPKQGTTLTMYYDHLNYSVSLGAKVYAGVTQLGTIFDMNVPGEGDHLHLAICVGTDQECVVGQDPKSGVLPKEAFPGRMINPWIVTNGGLYK